MDPGLLLGEQEGPEVFHKQHQTHLVNGGRAEAEAEVKGTCRNVNGLHEHSSDANGIRSVFGAQECILQERDTEALALLRTVDREAA